MAGLNWEMSESSPKVFKAKTPPALVIGLVIGGIALIVGIFFSVWWLSQQNIEARMRGTVVEKEFIEAPEQRVTIGRSGLEARQIEGEFLIYVDVPNRAGQLTRYRVDLRTRDRFDAIEVGDTFDVGPYLVPVIR